MNLRDHGLPTLGTPKGKPTWKISDPPLECPNCGAITCVIVVEMEAGTDPVAVMAHSMMGEGTKWCRYMGCPACPWASRAMLTNEGGT